MAQFPLTLTSSRPTPPDISDLRTRLRTASGDATAEVVLVDLFLSGQPNSWTFLKSTPWSAAQTTALQTHLDNATNFTPQLGAQQRIDDWPIELKALALTLIDQLNIIRAALPTPLPPITPAQALAAVRTKAGNL